MQCGKRCLQSWRRWTKAAHSGRLTRVSRGAVTYGGSLVDAMTKKLPQVDFEISRLWMLQLPQYHPLSSVMRLEPYRYFEFDAELQQYTPAFMGVHCEAAAYLSMVNAQVAQGTRLHLVDSGSSVFTSPHKDTLWILREITWCCIIRLCITCRRCPSPWMTRTSRRPRRAHSAR